MEEVQQKLAEAEASQREQQGRIRAVLRGVCSAVFLEACILTFIAGALGCDAGSSVHIALPKNSCYCSCLLADEEKNLPASSHMREVRRMKHVQQLAASCTTPGQISDLLLVLSFFSTLRSAGASRAWYDTQEPNLLNKGTCFVMCHAT